MDENFDNLRHDHPEENKDHAQEVQKEPWADEDVGIRNIGTSGLEINRPYQDSGRVYSFPRHDDNIRMDRGGAAVAQTSTSIYQILGWICAALAAFVSPLFAIAGVIFGVMVNRNTHRGGKAIIITNVVLAAINILFGLVFIAFIRSRMGGF